MSIRWPGDNFYFGLFAGLILMLVSFLSLRAIRLAMVDHYENPYFFDSPKVELLSILINLIFFRIIIVNLKREKTGRGILFGTVIISLIFFILFFKYNFRLP